MNFIHFRYLYINFEFFFHFLLSMRNWNCHDDKNLKKDTCFIVLCKNIFVVIQTKKKFSIELFSSVDNFNKWKLSQFFLFFPFFLFDFILLFSTILLFSSFFFFFFLFHSFSSFSFFLYWFQEDKFRSHSLQNQFFFSLHRWNYRKINNNSSSLNWSISQNIKTILSLFIYFYFYSYSYFLLF